jgi:hypothetical protein
VNAADVLSTSDVKFGLGGQARPQTRTPLGSVGILTSGFGSCLLRENLSWLGQIILKDHVTTLLPEFGGAVNQAERIRSDPKPSRLPILGLQTSAPHAYGTTTGFDQRRKGYYRH